MNPRLTDVRRPGPEEIIRQGKFMIRRQQSVPFLDF